MKLFKFMVKWFFYPRVMIIADERYNILCFMLFLVSVYFVRGDAYVYYIGISLIYLVVGQNLPRPWLKEFYDVDGFDNNYEEEESGDEEDENAYR